MESSLLYLFIMMIAAAVTVYANSKYQSLKDAEKQREVSERVAKVLLPELKFNKDLIKEFEREMEGNRIPIPNFSSTAWETISSSGLLLNLKPERIELLTWHYALIKHCAELKNQIIKYSTGVEAAMSGSVNTVTSYMGNLKKSLGELKANIALLEKE